MAEWWESYEDRSPINYPRRDDAPQKVVGKVPQDDPAAKWPKIRVFTTRRPWPRLKP